MTTTNNSTTDASVNKLAVNILSLNLVTNSRSTYGEAKVSLPLYGRTYELDMIIREKYISYLERKKVEEQRSDLHCEAYEIDCVGESSRIEESLKLVGLTFDYTELISRYASLIESKKAEDKQKQIEKLSSYYDSLNIDVYMNYLINRTKYISELRLSKEDYIKEGVERPVVILVRSTRKVNHTEKALVSFNSSVEISLSISDTGVRLQKADVLDNNETKYIKKRSNKTETVTASLVFNKLETMIDELHNENLRKLQREYERKELIAATSAKLNYNITEFRSVHIDPYSRSRKCVTTTNKAFIVRKDSDKKQCVAVHFDVSPDGEVYNIKNIYGNLSKDTVKKILDILNNEAEMVYNSDLSK